MADKRYNGWTNYETWAVNLWLSNDEGSSRYWEGRAQRCWDEAEADQTFSRDETAARGLAEALQAEVEEGNPLAVDASLWSDLLGAALAEVSWHEIAEGLLSGVDRSADQEGEPCE